MTNNVEKLLQKLYYDPGHPAGYTGLHTLHRAANEYVRRNKVWKKKIRKKIRLAEVRHWLQEQDTYTLHKPVRRKFPRNRVVVAGIDHQWQGDLADVSAMAKDNRGYRYLLCVIDVFSKYA